MGMGMGMGMVAGESLYVVAGRTRKGGDLSTWKAKVDAIVCFFGADKLASFSPSLPLSLSLSVCVFVL